MGAKATLVGTPFYPFDSNVVRTELVRLQVKEQIENECGARVCVHAKIISDYLKRIDMDSVDSSFLKASLEVELNTPEAIFGMVHARAWVWKC